MDTFFSNEFLDMLVRFLICVLVVWIIIDRFYSAKSKRRDFYFTFMLISIAIFFIVFFMIFVLEDMKGKTSMGIGIGLFGIFSIMRYRTDSMPVREMTYLFVTICLSVVNALAVSMSYYELVATNIIFIISVWLCEKRLKLSPSKLIQYDRIELIKPERREELVENLKLNVLFKDVKTQDQAKEHMINKIAEIMQQPEDAYDFEQRKSAVLLIGVNGVGKTTTVGKLAKRYSREGKKVILAGADTFRAAAADQLQIWSERTGCYMISGKEGSDPGAVVFDAARAAKAREADILLCDTAGRLHNKKNLMNELAKIDKILASEFDDAVRKNIVILDAATGQNALAQAREFKDIMKVDGVILTKMDGTAKGGIAVAITKELGVPVLYTGVGEGADDLMKFDPRAYAEGLFNE